MGGNWKLVAPAVNTSGSPAWTMTIETRIALFLVVELLAALRVNDPGTFKQWIAGSVTDLGEPADRLV